MARLSSPNKTQHLAHSPDALSCTEAGELCFMLLKSTAKLWMLFVIDHAPHYFSRSSGLKGERCLILRMPAHLLYISSCALIFPGSFSYLLWEKWFLSVKDHFWIFHVDGYGWFSAIAGAVSILGQCFSNFNVDVNHLGVLLTDFDAVGLRWGLKFCVSQKFSGDADVAGPQTTLGAARILCSGHKMPIFDKFLLACNKKRKIIM